MEMIVHRDELPLPGTYELALTDFRSGDRRSAEARCLAILDTQPLHPGANHLMGVVQLLSGNAVAGESLIRTALSVEEHAQSRTDLGLTLLAQRKYPDAERELRRALQLEPSLAIAHSTLGRIFSETGNTADAEAAYRQAIQYSPDTVGAHFELGELLARTRRFFDAIVPLRRAVELNPALAKAHNCLGIALGEHGQKSEAEAAFRRALECDSGFVEAACNLATLLIETARLEAAESVLHDANRADPEFLGARLMLARLMVRRGRIPEAIGEYRAAAALKANDAGLRSVLGGILAEHGHFEEAEVELRRAVELDPQCASAHSNLGSLLTDTHRSAEAEVELRRALELDEKLYFAAHNLSVLLRNSRRLDEAEQAARRALAVAPNFLAARVGLGNVLLAKNSGDISEALHCFEQALENDPNCLTAHSNLAYTLTFNRDDGREILEECERLANHFEAPYLKKDALYRNSRSRRQRLRVGYVSPDFRVHCQSLFTTPLLKGHDHAAVEVFCYSSTEKPDAVTKELAGYSDVWRDVHALDDDQLALQIADDEIDILVDLTMHMSKGRPLLFARRAAPVQVAWLAYPGTTGSRAIGYRLTDPWIDPPPPIGDDSRYSEKSIRLPDTFWCYDPLTSGIDVGPLPAYATGHITFGCLNNPCKLTDRTFALWARVMNEVPQSRLTLLLAKGSARDIVSSKFEALGVGASRLNLVDYQPREQYLRSYQAIDIVLETLPYNGHTTSLDALWMGVPVVTLPGSTPVSRAGYSLLSNLGLGHLAATSEDEFVSKAVALAGALPELSALRASLRERMEQSPLMDGARFARGVERAYQLMWEEWLAS
jgi:protein O-GlcNAc transferase